MSAADDEFDCSGPNVIHADGKREWFCKGRLHNESGPAVIHADGRREWFINGVRQEPPLEDADVLHPETARAVVEFATALKQKLLRAQQNGRGATGWKDDDWESECKAQLAEHVAKGDPLDVAAYSMFCWVRGWRTV
jgi:hypothetical protein